MAALRALVSGLNDVRLKGYAYIWSNIAFVVLCLPVFTAPAALSALYRVSYEAQTNPSTADLSLFWQTFKANIGRAGVWGLAHTAYAIVNFGNLIAYADAPGAGMMILRLVWLGSSLVWFGVVLYTWPLYYAMERPNLLTATRNALVMVLQNPFFTIIILLALMLLMGLSIILVGMWFVLTFAVIAALGTAAVLHQITRQNTILNGQTG